MADNTSVTKVFENQKQVGFRLLNFSDGTGEATTSKVTFSTLLNAPANLTLTRVIWSIGGMTVRLFWAATVNISFLNLAPGSGDLDFTRYGGFLNNAGAGKTGDVKLSTVGAAVNSTYTIFLIFDKI